jgi:hypothetical protein
MGTPDYSPRSRHPHHQNWVCRQRSLTGGERNEVERLFRRLKGFRRIFSRFEILDVMFVGFISFALIADGLRLC